MNKLDFVHKITVNLRENNMKKPVRSPKQVFHISDDDGNSKDFVIKAAERSYIYTEEDVKRILDAALEELANALQNGDDVNITGYGSIGLKFRKERRMKNGLDINGEYITLPGHNVPKLFAGKRLKVAAKIFDMKSEESSQKIGYRYDNLTDA